MFANPPIPVLEIRVARVACWEDQRHLGGLKSWVTKNLIAEKAEGTKPLARSFIHLIEQMSRVTLVNFSEWSGAKTQNMHLFKLLNKSKFMRFLGGPNGPKICARRTKTDFKDRGGRPLENDHPEWGIGDSCSWMKMTCFLSKIHFWTHIYNHKVANTPKKRPLRLH